MMKTEIKLNVSVEDIMTKQVHTVNVSDKMIDVRMMMVQNHIQHAPVMDGNKLVGILSMSDVRRMTFSETYGDDEEGVDGVISDMFSAEMIMHHHPETLEYDHPIREAALIFIERDFHALPVIRNNKMVGIITNTDILKYFVQII